MRKNWEVFAVTKFYTAFTKEIDDTEAAVAEILEQLDPAKNVLKNTIGIVYFYYEFAETDALQAIADALPFEVAGCVSTYIGANQQHGDVAISVTMITSDDAHFSIKILEDMEHKSKEQITEEMLRICGELSAVEKPKLIMPLIAAVPHFSGDDFVSVSNALPESIPFFGTVAFNMETTEGNHFVVEKGKISTSMITFVALRRHTSEIPRYLILCL